MSVEETLFKDKKCILLRIKGGKQFVLQCEVSFEYYLFRRYERVLNSSPHGEGAVSLSKRRLCPFET